MLDLSECEFLAPSINLMSSFATAAHEGFQVRTDGPFFSAEDIKQMKESPQLWLDEYLNPPFKIPLPDGSTIDRVPSTAFWLAQGNEFVGSVSIRFHLNKFLLQNGGHIGYSVRPKYRKQGAAGKMLKQSLHFCFNEIGLKDALVTCDEANLASAKVIEKNGGRLWSIVPLPYDKSRSTKRYWVPTLPDAP